MSASFLPAPATDPQGSFLGSTIEEKTRRILGWTEDYTPSCGQFPQGVTGAVPNLFAGASQKNSARKEKPKKTKMGSPAGLQYPYSLISSEQRSRKSSTGSDTALKQQLTPPPSPAPLTQSNGTFVQRKLSHHERADPIYGSLPVSPVSPNTPNPYSQQRLPVAGRAVTDSQVFERLRKLVDHMPTDRNAYQILVRTVTSVIELEHELQSLKEKTQGVRSILQNRELQPNSLPTPVSSPSCSALHNSPSPHCFSVNISQTNSNGNWVADPAVPEDLLAVDVSEFKSLVSPGTRWEMDADLFAAPHSSPGLDSLTVDTTSLCC